MIRDSNGAIVGVVSGRDDMSDRSLLSIVWLAWTGNLASLATGVSEITVDEDPSARPTASVMLTRVEVRPPGRGIEETGAYGGVRQGFTGAIPLKRKPRAEVLCSPDKYETRTRLRSCSCCFEHEVFPAILDEVPS